MSTTPEKPPGGNPLNDPALAIARYRTEIDLPSKEMRIVFYGKTDRVLGYLTLKADEVYALGSHVLHHYDQLEGIANKDGT